MFDVGWSELIVIGVVSLVVIGPKELPGVIRNVGRAVAKLRTMAGDFRHQFDEAMREADLADVQKGFAAARDAATGAYQAATSPLATLKDEISASVASLNEGALALEAELSGATAQDVALAPAAPSSSEPSATAAVASEAQAAALPPAATQASDAVRPKRRKKAVAASGEGQESAGQEDTGQENAGQGNAAKEEGAAS